MYARHRTGTPRSESPSRYCKSYTLAPVGGALGAGRTAITLARYHPPLYRQLPSTVSSTLYGTDRDVEGLSLAAALASVDGGEGADVGDSSLAVAALAFADGLVDWVAEVGAFGRFRDPWGRPRLRCRRAACVGCIKARVV